MGKLVFLILALGFGSASVSQTVVAAHAIRARSIITLQDIDIIEGNTVGGLFETADIVGMEARVNLYSGRAIKAADIGPPSIVERNQLVVMVYMTNLLSISTEGRVLARAGAGERVRVMNLSSRQTVSGTVMPDGTVEVGP